MSFRAFLDVSFEPACLADASGSLLHANDAFADMLGRGVPDVLSCSLSDILGRQAFGEFKNVASGQIWTAKRLTLLNAAGEALPVEARGLVLQDTGGFLLFFKARVGFLDAQEAEHMALHDALTGLPNRVLLLDRLRQTLVRVTRHNDFAAVVFIDLDGFKPINDTYGHDCGDEVLRVTATRLSRVVRGDDTAARIGGDEFVMVLSELRNGLHAGLTANRIIKSITQPIPWRGGHVCVSASLGISVAPSDGTAPEELLQKADEAMYVAKKSGKNGYSFSNESSYFD